MYMYRMTISTAPTTIPAKEIYMYGKFESVNIFSEYFHGQHASNISNLLDIITNFKVTLLLEYKVIFMSNMTISTNKCDPKPSIIS